MLERPTTKISRRCLVALAAVIASVIPAWSQEQTIRRVTHIKVKSGHVADFRAAIEAESAALKKAGAKYTRTVWRSLTGPNEFALVRMYSKYAEMDDPALQAANAGVAAAYARVGALVESAESEIDQVLTDLSIMPPPGTTPNMVRIVRNRVRPDKIEEFRELMKNEMMPAQKKGGETVYIVSRPRYGQRTQDFMTVQGIRNWAALDGESPLRKALGQDGVAKLMAKINSMVVSTEVRLYRYMPEMSLIPAGN